MILKDGVQSTVKYFEGERWYPEYIIFFIR